MPTITETKCTCQACGNIWFYGGGDVLKQTTNTLSNMRKSAMCCAGCLPAVFIPDKKVVDLGKCPKCGSKAVRKEQVYHEA